MALRIKELRLAAGLTQRQLAEMVGMDRSQLSKIEAEKEPVNTRRLAAFAKAFDVTVAELFTADSEEEALRLAILAVIEDLSFGQRAAVLDHARALAALRERERERDG